jgi:hypothetical protein
MIAARHFAIIARAIDKIPHRGEFVLRSPSGRGTLPPSEWAPSQGVFCVMSKEDAEAAVKSELRARKLTKPMTSAEVLMFCQEMYSKLQFRSKSDRLSDIRVWTERWQSTMFG